MSCIRSVWLGAALTAAMLGAGCTGPSSMSRIDANRELYESWPLDIQQAVLEQRVINGMNYQQVEMAVGKPAEKTSRATRKGTEEIWIYRERGSGGGLGNMPISIGGSIGGVGASRSSGGGYVGEEYEVVFVDGQVVRTTLPPPAM